MKSFLAAGAILTLSLCCARAEADFPQRPLGPQAQTWRSQVPTYPTQHHSVPNNHSVASTIAAQPYRPYSPAVPFHAHTGQAVPANQPADPYAASVPPAGSFSRGALMASAPHEPAAIGSGLLNDPFFKSGSNYQAPVAVAAAGSAPTNNHVANPYEQAMAASSWCNNPAPVAKGCPTWFGGVYGLIMRRAGEENFYVFNSDTDPSVLFCPSSDFETDYIGGAEARIGRTFCCGKWGMEAVYWGLNSNSESATIDAAIVPGTMRSTVDYSLVWAGGLPITDVTDNINFARVSRREEFHNGEINLLSGPLTLAPTCGACGTDCGGACGTGARGYTPGLLGRGNRGRCGPRWVANWVFGFRYFKFDEDISIFMDRDDAIVGSTNFEIDHDIDVENNLYGFQFGTEINYCLTDCLNLDFGSKFGIYGNHATQDQQIYNPLGPAIVLPGTPQDFTVQSQEDDVAFLGELRLGFGYRVGCHFRFTGGYRAIAASGVATALGQINHGRTLGNLASVADIDTDDSLVLHGAYVGTEFAW